MTGLVIFIVLLSVLVSCGSVNYTQTGEVYKPRGKNCKFRVYTTQPKYEFDEIGVIDLLGKKVSVMITDFRKT